MGIKLDYGYPPGAIRSEEELTDLIEKGEVDKIYAASGGVLLGFKLSDTSEVVDGILFVYNPRLKVDDKLDIRAFNIPFIRARSFLFANYWYGIAWAQKNRKNNA